MDILNIIIVILFLYLIYNYMYSRSKKPIESFSNLNLSPGKNFLPQLSTIPVSPFKDCINGELSVISSILKQTSYSTGNCYTNNFMFTPVCKAKNNATGKFNTYVFSGQCENKSAKPVDVEMWIFGLNSGRRHFVDHSYQDFISIKKSIPPKLSEHIELLFKPRHSLTEYIAVRLDVNTASSEIDWSNLQLELFNPSNPGLKKTPPIFSHTDKTGKISHLLGGLNFSILADGCSENYTPCSYPALQQYGHVEGGGRLLDGTFKNLNGEEITDQCSALTSDKAACGRNPYCVYDESSRTCYGKTHCCRNDINSAFPLNWTSNNKFKENYIKLKFKFNIYESSPVVHSGTFGSNIFYNVVKHFIRINNLNEKANSFDDSNNFYLFLLKESQKSSINYGIYDITLNREGNKLGLFEIKDYVSQPTEFIGGKKFEGRKGTGQDNYFSPLQNLTEYSGNDNSKKKSIVELTLNIYYKLPTAGSNPSCPSSNNSDYFGCSILQFIKSGLKEYMNNKFKNSTKISRDFPKFFTVGKQNKSFPLLDDQWNEGLDYEYDGNNANGILEIQQTSEGECKRCGIENNNKICTSSATMEDCASNIQGICSCTHCTNIVGNKKILTGKSDSNNLIILPGQGTCNMCNMTSNLNWFKITDPTKCKADSKCSWNDKDSPASCNAKCDFASPINYKTVGNNVSINLPNKYKDNNYIDTCPVPDDLKIESSNNSVIETNECQIYFDKAATYNSKLNKLSVKSSLNTSDQNNTAFKHRIDDLELPLYSWKNEGNTVVKFNINVSSSDYNLYARLYKGEHITYLKNSSGTVIPVSIELESNNKSKIIRVDAGASMLHYLNDKSNQFQATYAECDNIGRDNENGFINASLLFRNFMQ